MSIDYYNCNLTIKGSGLYALPSFQYYWFCLDLALNNTIRIPNRLSKCILLFRTKDANIRNLLTAVYGSLIPLTIGANLLKIASQILFLTLFVSDLPFGMVQIPSKIYLLWESSEPTCFEVQLSAFSMPFPMCMSFNLLCAISIERYIYIVHNRFYKRTVTKKLLAIAIISLILRSFIWATTDAHLRAKLDIVKLAKTYITLSAYSGTVLAIGVVFNVALLRNIKRKTQKSLAQYILDSRIDNRFHGGCLFTNNHSYQYCCICVY